MQDYDFARYVAKSMEAIGDTDNLVDPSPYTDYVDVRNLQPADVVFVLDHTMVITSVSNINAEGFVTITGHCIDCAEEMTHELAGNNEVLRIGPGDEGIADFVSGYIAKAMTTPRPCSLAASPKQNWIERLPPGLRGLPDYMCNVITALLDKGYPKKLAYPMGIGIVKAWAKGLHGVHADTVAKAQAATAKWEAMKAYVRAHPEIGSTIG